MINRSLLFIFIGISSCFAQSTSQLNRPYNDSFKVGEWFEYRVHYLVFNASYASLELRNDTINGVPVFHTKGYGKTIGLARLFFKVEDYYESYFNPKTGMPVRFIRNINEGGYTKNIEINFDHKQKTAEVLDKKTNEIKYFDIKPNTQDMMSAFYYLRNFFPKENLEVNESFSVNMFFDNENYEFKLKFLGKETLKTKFGRIECLKFRPVVQSGRVFREKESLTVWISNDKNQIPVRIQADIAVGSIKMDLENFKNLKHPLKIIIK